MRASVVKPASLLQKGKQETKKKLFFIFLEAEAEGRLASDAESLIEFIFLNFQRGRDKRGRGWRVWE